MTNARLKMSHEGVLWKTALRHLGAAQLRQVVVGLWLEAGPPARATVEYLDASHVSSDVLNILRDVQTQVGALVPYRPVECGRISIYCAHAEHLAYGILKILPVGILPPQLKGARLESDLGM
jgi:hypothetical protein